MLRAACLLLVLCFARSQYYPFCLDGISLPDFADDAGQPSVDVIMAQAPLFSTNPAIGQKLSLINLYHTSLILAQGNETNRRFWTLEFDFTGGNLIKGSVPKINGSTLTWTQDARYCLTEGLLWGREHWTKQFETVMSLTTEQARRAFTDFLIPLNSSAPGEKPQYQLWRVVRSNWFYQPEQTLLEDVTCADGALWFLHYVATELQVAPNADFRFRGSATYVEVNRLERVDTADPHQWSDVVAFYGKMDALINQKKPLLSKLLDVMNVAVARKYVYDTNSKVYYRIHGTIEPWFHFRYVEYPLRGSAWLSSSSVDGQSQSISGYDEEVKSMVFAVGILL